LDKKAALPRVAAVRGAFRQASLAPPLLVANPIRSGDAWLQTGPMRILLTPALIRG
jgi:hypothetical protein